ncbi:hypothetical protein GXW83_21685 [Streptacidiphilus sp. PB12-B1b]|uniref:hypothetical protein n=1 Tax=Streptacidiphilus sp. PB12-B1b TaxID=2705012 RepID=UPI0015F8B80F|nr:hypothetical protein [Streptacidiphilus sp. PB12-B1b]QMU77916.1 hypothetical protein GXW83_21685 [Streptacidiphilus sp. PB12-B1b]
MSFYGVLAGATLLFCPEHGPSRALTRLAESLPGEPGRFVVVADAPNERDAQAFWSQLADLLQGKGPVRLVIPGAGSGHPLPRAEWLAGRLLTEVVAPDGFIAPANGGRSVFVVRDSRTDGQTGAWLSFRAGTEPVPGGPRYPAPRWEEHLPSRRWFTGPVGMAEPIPAGLWIHRRAAESLTGQWLAKPLFDLPTLPETLTVVLGAPGEPWLPEREFRELLHRLPWLDFAPAVRLVSYSPASEIPLGQLLADRLGRRVVITSGLPSQPPGDTNAVVLHDPTGRPAWKPFATEMAYWPWPAGTGPEPEVVSFREPFPGLTPVGDQPGVFEFGGGLLLEVVQSGLWLRAAHQTPDATVRGLPPQTNRMRLTVGVPGQATPDELVRTAALLARQLDAETQPFVHLAIQRSPGSGRALDSGPHRYQLSTRPVTAVSGAPGPAAIGPAPQSPAVTPPVTPGDAKTSG